MLYKELPLNSLLPEWTRSDSDAHVTLYLQQPSQEWNPQGVFPCVVVCPGGGYGMTSDREAEPVALRYAGAGYSAVVVRYSTEQCHYPMQLCEVSVVFAWLRRHARELSLDPGRLAVCGFSAGGHLAGTLCNLYHLPFLNQLLHLQPGENRPDAAVLGYPVITTGAYRNEESFSYLIGDDLDQEALRNISLENSAHPQCPPCFLWHTAADTDVPCENSLLYAAALRRCGVLVELHLFPFGPHGLSLCDETSSRDPAYQCPEAADWFRLSVRFLRQILGSR